MSGSLTPRIACLLTVLADCKRDLAEAPTPELASLYRHEVSTVRHSLWLAGYQPENEEA